MSSGSGDKGRQIAIEDLWIKKLFEVDYCRDGLNAERKTQNAKRKILEFRYNGKKAVSKIFVSALSAATGRKSIKFILNAQNHSKLQFPRAHSRVASHHTAVLEINIHIFARRRLICNVNMSEIASEQRVLNSDHPTRIS